MPGRDRTGPQGQGPMTGRGHRKCNPQDRATVSSKQGGMGSGSKIGRGRRQGPGRGADRGAGRGAGQGRGSQP